MATLIIATMCSVPLGLLAWDLVTRRNQTRDPNAGRPWTART